VAPLLSESGIIAEADWQNMTDSFSGKTEKKKDAGHQEAVQ